jgi:hypothetical protein
MPQFRPFTCLLLILAAHLGAEMIPRPRGGGGMSRPSYRFGASRNNITLGLGAGLPRKDLSPGYQPAVNLTVGYGYRPIKYFQADGGFETMFRAARINDFVESDFGFLRIRDSQYFVPMGGRAILPIESANLEIYGGGGLVYMNYREQLQQPSPQFRLQCPDCRRRGGWGHYFTAGTDYYFNDLFKIGAQARVYNGNTEGDNLGNLPFRTNDRWLQFTVNFGVTF